MGVNDIVIDEITYWLQIGYSCRQDSIASATIISLGALFLQEFFLSDFLMRTKGKSNQIQGRNIAFGFSNLNAGRGAVTVYKIIGQE